MTGGWEWEEVITRVPTAEAEGALTTELGNVVNNKTGIAEEKIRKQKRHSNRNTLGEKKI